MLLYLLLGLLALSPAAAADPGVTWARFQQEELPAWQARGASAEARAEAARAYFAGNLPLLEAFPSLEGVPLDSPSWLSSQLARLDAAGAARAAERFTPAPELPAAWQAEQRESARVRALDAEDEADGLERRLLLALQQLIKDHPELSRAALDPVRAQLKARLAQADATASATAGAEDGAGSDGATDDGAGGDASQGEEAGDAGDGEAGGDGGEDGTDAGGDDGGVDSTDPEEAREAVAAARAKALAEAARAGEDLRRLELLVAGIRHAATARVPAPSPDEDLALLDDPAAADAARLRLALLRPFLSEQDQRRIDASEQAALIEEQIPTLVKELVEIRTALEALRSGEYDASSLPVAALEARLAEREGVLRDAEAELATYQGIDDSMTLLTARRTRAGLLKDLAQARRDYAALALERARDSARAAREQAEQTREALEREKLEDSESARLRVQLIEALADAQDRRGEVTDALATAREQRTAWLTAHRSTTTELETRAQEILTRTGALAGRQRLRDLDTAYSDLRKELTGIRSEAIAADQALRKARRANTALADERDARLEVLDALVEALGAEALLANGRTAAEVRQDWLDQVSARAETLADAEAEARTHRDEVVHLLERGRQLRRELKPEISADEFDKDRALLAENVRQELTLLGPSLATQGRDLLEWLARLPSRLLHPGWLWGLLMGSIWLLAVGLIWLWARRRAQAMVHWALDRWAERDPDPLRRHELQALEKPAVPVVVAVIDVALGYALYGPVREAFAELGLVLLVYLQFATFRLLMCLYELLVAHDHVLRPALATLDERSWARARRTVRVLALWVILHQFIAFLTREVLGTDAISEVCLMVLEWALIFLAAGLLYEWEPSVRQALSSRGASNAVTGYLTTEPRYALERSPRALVGGMILISSSVWHLLDLRATDRSALGQIFNWINRQRLAREETATTRRDPAPAKLRSAILLETCPDDWFIERPLADDAFATALDGWMKERRAGRVVIIGDRGDGKGCWLDRRSAGLANVGWRVTRSRLSRLITTEAELVRWFRKTCELETEAPLDDIGDLIAALMDMPGRVWVLEGLECCFLRTVGGFEAVRALFQLIQQCSEHHFWVISVHRPAWRYLSRLSSLFDARFFRAEIELAPLRDAQLRELVGRRTATAGYTPSFTNLERSGLRGGDPESERQRAERTFFRLLSESSQGNAGVALRFWADSLSPGGEEGVVNVSLPTDGESALKGLTDTDLFILTAVRVQDELDEDELAQATNLTPAVVRAAVRSLLDRRLLDTDADRVRIPIEQLTAVTRLLRRRHFLQWPG
jgi:hypothetical protein